jgi:hypothetical protein
VREQEALKHQLEVELNLCKLQLIQVRLQVFFIFFNFFLLFIYLSTSTGKVEFNLLSAHPSAPTGVFYFYF